MTMQQATSVQISEMTTLKPAASFTTAASSLTTAVNKTATQTGVASGMINQIATQQRTAEAGSKMMDASIKLSVADPATFHKPTPGKPIADHPIAKIPETKAVDQFITENNTDNTTEDIVIAAKWMTRMSTDLN